MQYTVIYNGQSYDLPNYSIKISDKLEEIEISNKGNVKFKDKCKKMYDFIADLLTKQIALDILGKFEESDPNIINIVYLEIVKSYNKPLADYSKNEMDEIMNSGDIDKILEITKALPSIKEMQKEKK